jgi:hypothetical protein
LSLPEHPVRPPERAGRNRCDQRKFTRKQHGPGQFSQTGCAVLIFEADQIEARPRRRERSAATYCTEQ